MAGGILTILLLAWLPQQLQAVDLRNKFSGSVTMGNAQIDITVTLPQAINLSTTLLLFTYRADDADSQEVLVGGELTSSTTIEFHRNSSGSTVEVAWQILDFISGVTVYRGSGTISNGSTANIGANVAEGRSWPIISYENDGSAFDSDDMASVALTNNSAPAGTYDRVVFTVGNGDMTGYWQVVECATGDCNVQTIVSALTNPATTATATIPTAVTPSQTLLFTSHTLSGDMQGDDLPRTEFTNGTTITHTRTDGDDISIPTITTYVVEFTDGTTTVQHGTLDVNSGVASQNATITSVAENASLVLSAGALGFQGSGGITNQDNPGGNWFSFDFVDASTIRATRANSTEAAAVSYQVAEFNYATSITWYTLLSGNWNNPNVWTLDGGVSPVQQPVGGGIPASGDQVVITNGKTVTMTGNNYSAAGATVFGTLDVANTTGHNLTAISGNGRIRLAGSPVGLDNFPRGDASAFSAAGQGTVILYGTGITLDKPHTFNNLEVFMNTNSTVATLLRDLMLNGTLYVKTGNLRINDNSATTPLRLNVASNVTIDNSASMSVGSADAYTNRMGDPYGDYHESFHVMRVGGNFTNQGQVRFTNQTQPDYDSPTTSGAVSLVFTRAANRTFNCNGVTDLYNLVIDKSSQTYELLLDASAKNHFSLFGQNNGQWVTSGGNEANPEMQKALWIKGGTLRLTGKVYVPTLTEGSKDWTIGENAALVLDGGDVFVASTARTNGNTLHPSIDYTGLSYTSAVGFDNGDGDQGVFINGTLRVNDGFFTTGYSNGLVYRAESPNNRLEIHGGEVRAGQFQISGDANTANAKMSYIQHGGVLRLVDNRTDTAIFDLKAAQSSFTMKGGEIIIEDLSGGTINALEIASPPSNIDVTGGTIVVDNTTGTQTPARISTTAPFYNFVLRNNRDQAVQLNTPLRINNDLTIENETFNANGNDLTIVGDMSVAGAGSYTTGNNTTIFIGDADSEIKFDNTTTTQTIQRLTLEKSDPSLVLDIKGTLATLQIDDELRVTKGRLQYGASNVHAKGDVHNTGVIGSNSTGTLALNGTAIQTLHADGGVFNNVTIDNATGVVAATDLSISRTLTLTNGILDINTHKLTMQGSQAAITTPATFDNTRMIQTAGNASDGGLEMYVDASETILFPIGTGANSLPRYTPANTLFGTVVDDGYVQISVADRILHTTNPSGDALSYYWRVRHREFSAIPTVEHQFTYASSDVVGTITDYVGGKVLDADPFTRSGEDFRDVNTDGDILDPEEGSADVTSVDEATNTVTFNYNGVASTGFTLEQANYTAGESSRFVGGVEIYYSRIRKDAQAWTNPITWSTIGHYSSINNSNSYPQEGDIAIIGFDEANNVCDDYHIVTLDTDITVASVVFAKTIVNSGGSETTRTNACLPQLTIPDNRGNVDLGVVSGEGTLRIELNCSPCSADPDVTVVTAANITADYGDFVSVAASRFDFEPRTDAAYKLPSSFPEVYPNVHVQGASGSDNRPFIFQEDITVNGDIVVRDGELRLNDGANGNITVKGDLRFDTKQNGDVVQFSTTGIARTLRVEGDIIMDDPNDAIEVLNNAPSGLTHTLQVGGSIIQSNGGVIDLYGGTGTNNNAVLELIGSDNGTYERTGGSNPSLYRIVMNKGIDTSSVFILENTVSLSGTSTGPTKALELQNGLLIFDHSDFGNAGSNIELANATTDPFYIPPTAGLEIRQGRLRVNGSASILLDGLLRISNTGHLDMGCGSVCDRHIEYGSSGRATIEVTGGWLDVASQIRRSPTNDAGVLKFRQTGGTVSVGRGGSQGDLIENRGMLEVLNAGSEFTLTGGNLTIYQQNGAAPSAAALVLDPDVYDLTGSTIHIGGQATQPDGSGGTEANNFTPATQTSVGIDARIPLNNLVINDRRPTPARIIDKALTIAGDLTIQSNSTLDANGITLTLLGDMNVDDNFTANGNETVFNGNTAQAISGRVDFYDLTKTNSNVLSLTNPATTIIGVANDLIIAAGTLDDGGNTVALSGDLIVDGAHTSGIGGDGIAFVGAAQQELRRSSAGNSSLGRITIDNTSGVVVPEGDGYSFTLQSALRLSKGVFNIGSNLLSLTTSAEIEAVNPFGDNNMIETNKSASDFGVEKFFAANRTTNFIFPIGQGSYTPARVDLSSQATYTFGSTAGSIRIAPVNEMHPTIKSDADQTYLSDGTTLGDEGNVLQYYWVMDADNISNSFRGDIVLEYDETLVRAEDPAYTEADYITAVLLSDNNADANITKTSGMVDPVGNTLKFTFSGVTDQGISGDYFAGINLAIPDKIPIYTTIQSGNVDGANVYDISPPGGIPNGAIVIVDATHTLTFNQENVRFYQTKIRASATLDLASTSIHSLGQLSGAGTLRVENDASLGLKGGTTFFDCGQGTIEYGGTGDYNVLANMPTVNRVRFTGSGARILPANNVVVCDDMIIDGPVLRNVSNVNVTIQGDTYVTSGSFETGSGNIDHQNNLYINGGTYLAQNGGNDIIRQDLVLSAGTFDGGTIGRVTLLGDLTRSGGTFTGGSGTALFVLGGNTSQTVSGNIAGVNDFFNQLEINNSAGATLVNNVDVAKALILTEGLITPNAIFKLRASASTSQGKATSYVNGILHREISSGAGGLLHFPVGKSDRWGNISISAPSVTGTWIAEYFNQDPSIAGLNNDDLNTDTDDTDIKEISQLEYWSLQGPSPGAAYVHLRWDSQSIVSGVATERDNLRVMQWNGVNQWNNRGFGGRTGDANYGTFQSGGKVGFSNQYFTLGSTTSTNVLPVELISFTANAQEQTVQLVWETASEIDNDYFAVQRSVDGVNFKKIGEVAGNGNTVEVIRYEFVDQIPVSGISYYQLKQVDFNGVFEYSDKISVEWISTGFVAGFVEVNLYPNPAPQGQAKLKVTGLRPHSTVTFKLLDMFGKPYMQQVIETDQLSQQGFMIQPRTHLATGVYVVSVQQGSEVHQKTLIVR